MMADLREEALRLAFAAGVLGIDRSREVVLYDAQGKPYCYVTATMVKPMTYVGSARYDQAMRLGGKPEAKVFTHTGLRCVQLSSGDVGRAWLRDDISRLAAGVLRSAEADPAAQRAFSSGAG